MAHWTADKTEFLVCCHTWLNEPHSARCIMMTEEGFFLPFFVLIANYHAHVCNVRMLPSIHFCSFACYLTVWTKEVKWRASDSNIISLCVCSSRHGYDTLDFVPKHQATLECGNVAFCFPHPTPLSFQTFTLERTEGCCLPQYNNSTCF